MTTVTLLICSRKNKSVDVKDAFRQLLNRHKKRLQENMHKVSKQLQCFVFLLLQRQGALVSMLLLSFPRHK